MRLPHPALRFLTLSAPIRYLASLTMTTHVTPDAPPMTHMADASPAASNDASDSAPQTPPEPKPWILRPKVRVTIYTLLILFVAGMLAWGIVPRLLDPDFKEHIRNKEVMAGMTREQVLRAWGSPYQTNITQTSEGVRREDWIYEIWISTSEFKHRYLYFEEGVLVGGYYYE